MLHTRIKQSHFPCYKGIGVLLQKSFLSKGIGDNLLLLRSERHQWHAAGAAVELPSGVHDLLRGGHAPHSGDLQPCAYTNPLVTFPRSPRRLIHAEMMCLGVACALCSSLASNKNDMLTSPLGRTILRCNSAAFSICPERNKAYRSHST